MRYIVEADADRSYITVTPWHARGFAWDRIDVNRIGRAESKRDARKICRQLNDARMTEPDARRVASAA